MTRCAFPGEVFVKVCMIAIIVLSGLFVDIPSYAEDQVEGTTETVLPSLFTGRFTYSVPISVPPGRHGIEPKLALILRSNFPLAAPLVGGSPESEDSFQLELGAIERGGEYGGEINYTKDIYRYSTAEGVSALTNKGNGEYRALIEKDFFRVTKKTATDGKISWELVDKSGIKYYFGRTAASRQDCPDDSSMIYKWCLERVEDLQGNYLDITYIKDQGQIYPKQIVYTGGESQAPGNIVEFVYENRNGEYSEWMVTNFNVTTAKRLQQIKAVSSGNLPWISYQLSYEDNTDRLSSIQRYSSKSTALVPPIRFEWGTEKVKQYDEPFIPKDRTVLKSIYDENVGKTSFEYTSTLITRGDVNNNTNYSYFLTVNKIIREDGNGNLSETTYEYSLPPDGGGWNGWFFDNEREFRGFRYVKVTGPKGLDNMQLVTETWFHQGNGVTAETDYPNVWVGKNKGKPFRTRISDTQGKVFSDETTTYGAAYVYPPYFSPPVQVDRLIYDGSGTPRQTRSVYSYDTYGNITQEKHYGDINDSADDRTVVRTFSPNTNAWILGLPATEDIYQGIGTSVRVAGTKYYYDDLTSCSATPTNNQTPILGNPTRTVRWNNWGSPSEIESRTAYNIYGNPVCTRDSKGNVTTTSYDSTNTFPVSVTNPRVQTTVTQYYGVAGVAADKGLYGQVKRITDPNGAVTAMEYDGYGRKTRETGPGDAETDWSYIDFGTVGSQRVLTEKSTGEWSEEFFDGLGRSFKTESRGPDGKTVIKETAYDARGNVSRSSLPYFRGDSVFYTTFDYDSLGRTLLATRPDSERKLSCYDASLGVTVTVDGEGHRKRETRDALDRLVKVEEYTGIYAACDTAVDAPYATTTYQYNVLGNLTGVIDTKGNRTIMLYDSLGRKYRMIDPDMGTWEYIYDANGNLISQSDAKSQTIGFSYDALNRIILKDYPAGGDVTYTYDETFSSFGKGRLTTMSDPSGTVKYYYDANGRNVKKIRTVDGISYQVETTYDDLDRIKTITYPDNETVSYNYDEGGNLSSIPGYATYTGYTALGSPGTIAFGNGVRTDNTYHPQNGRLLTGTTGKDATAYSNLSYTYFADGNINFIGNQLDAAKNQIFVYDELSRLTQAQSPAYGSLSYSYDQIGNLLTKEGAVYSYGSSRPHAVTGVTTNGCYPGDTRNGDTCIRTDTYEAYATYSCTSGDTINGAFCSHESTYAATSTLGCNPGDSFNGSICTHSSTITPITSYTCNAGDTLSSQTCIHTTTYAATATTISKGNYLLPLCNSLTLGAHTHAAGGSCGFGESLLGYTSQEAFGGGQALCKHPVFGSLGLVYSQDGACTSGDTAMGTVNTETFTGGKKLCRVVVLGIVYSDDSCGTSDTLLGYVASSPGAVSTTTYSCNAGDTLKGQTCSNTQTYAATVTKSCQPGYTFDGSMCNLTFTYAPYPFYSCNSGDTLRVADKMCLHTETYAATPSYSCPSGGTLSGSACTKTSSYPASGSRTLTYDGNGNMSADGQRSIVYDYDNMPKTVTRDGFATSFVYDGNGTRVKKITPGNTTVYLDNLYECVNGSCGKYIFANGKRIAMKTSAKTLYYHPDHLGSTTVVTDASGVKVEDAAYYPFGATRLETGSAYVNHLYTGQELDAETGLYNYGARMYDPELGRFISPDSIVPDPTDPQSFNRYSYVRNNPLNLIDPTGHWYYDDDRVSTDWGFSDFFDRAERGFVPYTFEGEEPFKRKEPHLSFTFPEGVVIGERPSDDGNVQNDPEKLISWTGLTRTASMPLSNFRETNFSKLRFLWPAIIPTILNPGNVAVIIGGAIVLYPTSIADELDINLYKKDKDNSPKSRQKGDGWKSGDDPALQLEEIERAQEAARQGKIKHPIDSIGKSEQRFKHWLKGFRF